MALACDNCKGALLWKLDGTKLETADPARDVPFSGDDVQESLTRVLASAYGGCPSVRPNWCDVVFHHFCTACWEAQAEQWGQQYKNARARTVETGIYFNVEQKAFREEDGGPQARPWREAILSCACHELMHFWSKDGKGLQDIESGGLWEWDEVITDVLGYLTYKDLFRDRFKAYVTPYEAYPKSIDQCDIKCFLWSAVVQVKKEGKESEDWEELNLNKCKLINPKSVTNLWKDIDQEKGSFKLFPARLRKWLSSNKRLGVDKDGMNRIKQMYAARVVQKLIFSSLAEWYFDGPQKKIDYMEDSFGKGDTCQEFLSSRIDKLIVLKEVFVGQVGGNVSIPL